MYYLTGSVRGRSCARSPQGAGTGAVSSELGAVQSTRDTELHAVFCSTNKKSLKLNPVSPRQSSARAMSRKTTQCLGLGLGHPLHQPRCPPTSAPTPFCLWGRTPGSSVQWGNKLSYAKALALSNKEQGIQKLRSRTPSTGSEVGTTKDHCCNA